MAGIHITTIDDFKSLLSRKRSAKPIRIYRISTVVTAYCIAEFVISLAIGIGILYSYTYAARSWLQSPLASLLVLLFSGSILGLSIMRDHYNKCVVRSGVVAVGSGISASFRASVVLLSTLFITKATDSYSRGSLLCLMLVTAAVIVSGRVALHIWARRKIATARLITDRTMVIGEHSRLGLAREDGGFFDTLRHEGVRVTAIKHWSPSVDERDACKMAQAAADRCRCDLIDSVILLPTAGTAPIAEKIADLLRETPLTIHVVPFLPMSGATPAGTSVGGHSSILLANSPTERIGVAAKRCFDILISGMMLFLLAPLLIGTAIAIKLESSGPVLFRQTRHGYAKKQFKVFKFRSMRVMEDGAAFRQAKQGDPRITSVGRFIRRTNIDELPQLVNVLLGDMSLVGPRPHPIALNDDFATQIRMFHRRHNIRPGITGWAQVNGFRGETDTYEKMQQRVDRDLWYVDNWSFMLDLRILVFTLLSPTAYANAG